MAVLRHPVVGSVDRQPRVVVAERVEARRDGAAVRIEARREQATHVLEEHGAREQGLRRVERRRPAVACVRCALQQPASREGLAGWPAREQGHGAAPRRVVEAAHVGAHRLVKAVAHESGHLACVVLEQRDVLEAGFSQPNCQPASTGEQVDAAACRGRKLTRRVRRRRGARWRRDDARHLAARAPHVLEEAERYQVVGRTPERLRPVPGD